MRTFKQAWWAPLAGVLALSEVGIALIFLFGDEDAESVAAGLALSLVGAAALVIGLVSRPHMPGLGDTLVIVGASMAAIWFWAVFMSPLAVVVIAGVVFSRVRPKASRAKSAPRQTQAP